MNINSLPESKFEEFVGGFRVTLFKSPQKNRVKTRDAMLRLIKENPSITRKELANLLNLTVKGIEWNIKQLKDAGILQRIEPDKGGHWEVVE